MTPLNLQDVADFIETNIDKSFHAKKIRKIEKITLGDIVKRKNPYLFRAKASGSANDFVKSVLDATVSSGEETTFGNFLERIAILVCEKVHNGRKSPAKGIDLEFENKGTKYLVSVKSGPNWGNAGQIRDMAGNFKTARKTLLTSGGSQGFNIQFVEGCCYGIDDTPEKGTHLKLCGQRFWSLMSGGDDRLYIELIKPLGHRASHHNDSVRSAYDGRLNSLTSEFVGRFCDDGIVNWHRLVEFNSGTKKNSKKH